jgi:hypothetical protein
MREILDIIGYSDDDHSPVIFYKDSVWCAYDDELCIADNEYLFENDGYYTYTISSYAAKGEKLFIGEKDGFTFIMAYPTDEGWSNTIIFILDNDKNEHKTL